MIWGGGNGRSPQCFFAMKPTLQTPLENPLQMFLSNRRQIGDVLEELLTHTGTATLHIATFSTGEEFLRRLLRIRQSGMVKAAHLMTDFRGAEKTARLKPMLTKAFDSVKLCRIHAKLMIIEGEQCSCIVLTSQNQTRGNRVESYVISSDSRHIVELKEQLTQIPAAPL